MKSTTLTTIGYCLVYAGILAGMVTTYFTGLPAIVDELANFAILVGISIATGTLSSNVDKAVASNDKIPNAREIGSSVLTETKELQNNTIKQNGDTQPSVNPTQSINEVVERKDVQTN